MFNDLITLENFRINTTQAVVSANFSEMRGLIIKTVDDHKALVTPETIPDSKKLAADFRKTAKALAAAWKEKRTASISDVLAADAQVKELCALLEDGANDITQQIAVIEDEVKKTCLSFLLSLREAYWREKEVRSEFCNANVDDLVKLGSLNAKRTDLSNPAKQAVKDRTDADLAMQTKIDGRLTKLEAECLKADINPPLSYAAVANFLYKDDYDAHLKALIEGEVSRKEAAEARLREKLEAEKQREIEAALKAQQAEANLAAKEAAAKLVQQAAAEAVEKAERERQAQFVYPDPPNRTPPPKVEEDKVFYSVTLKLRFQAKPAPDAQERIVRFMTKKMADNGLTVEAIHVERS